MLKTKKILLAFILLIGWSLSYAQISEGGIPPSFAYENMTKSLELPILVKADFDIEEQIRLDEKEQDENLIAIPLRIGKMLPVEINVTDEGIWTTLPDGKNICQLSIQSPGALAMMLYYAEFHIPLGGELFIYNKEKTHVIGGYSHLTNPYQKEFATEFVGGDELTIEYVSSQSKEELLNQADKPRIILSHVVYGYNYIDIFYLPEELKTGFYNEDKAACMVNINCVEGANWQTEKKGIAASIAPERASDYVSMCSGTLVNNTREDLTPYYLTAYHCFKDGAELDLAKTIFYFHYELPGCEMLPNAPKGSKTIVGAEILASNPTTDGSDGQLLKLSQRVPEDYDVYYNGWDRRNISANSGVGIHHPRGDVKKISTFIAPATTRNWTASGPGAIGAHWNVAYVKTETGHSVTTGGSSGSPLFNENHLIVGTLTGGSSSCTNLTGSNAYGKMFFHWDQHKDPDQHFSRYLDPLLSGTVKLNGTSKAANRVRAKFIPDETDVIVFGEVTYSNLSINANTYDWSFEGGTPSNFNEKTPPSVTYNQPGKFKTTLTINKGTDQEYTYTETIEVKEKGDNPDKPQAIFSVGEELIMEESFDFKDANDFPSTGWKSETRGESSNEWRASNSKSNNFDKIDPDNLFSATISYDSKNLVDAWLFSDKYSIKDKNTILEYYACYNTKYLSGGKLSFYISVDGGDFVEKWTTGSTDGSVGGKWYQLNQELSEYVGREVQFAWQYYGKDGDNAYIDGVQLKGIKDINAPMNIHVGDYIEPIDYSTGVPILYEWTFKGGDPAIFSGENPQVSYYAPGSFDIELYVKNYRGDDRKVQKNAVVVKHPLTVKADNVKKNIKDKNPDVTNKYTISGFVDNDDISYLSKKPEAFIDPDFVNKQELGRYKGAILVSGGEDQTNKYTFVYQSGDLVVTDSPTDLVTVEDADVSIYPTVTTGVLHVYGLTMNENLQVFDLSGKIVLAAKLHTGNNTININMLNNGLYLVKVGTLTIKIIKQ